jgi:hypothetical protein
VRVSNLRYFNIESYYVRSTTHRLASWNAWHAYAPGLPLPELEVSTLYPYLVVFAHTYPTYVHTDSSIPNTEYEVQLLRTAGWTLPAFSILRWACRLDTRTTYLATGCGRCSGSCKVGGTLYLPSRITHPGCVWTSNMSYVVGRIHVLRSTP